MPPGTTALIVANVAIFLLEQVAPGSIGAFALWPLGAAQAGGASFAPWQLVTYAFLHGGMLHLAFNMFALYMFGGAIEQVFGTRRYVTYYIVCAITAALKDPETLEAFRKQGYQPMSSNPKETATLLRADHDRWAPILKAANVVPQ